VQVQTGTGQISSAYNPDHKNFAPRFGFAWDTNGKGTTVIRGGGGLVYETVNWQSFIAFNNAFGPGSVPTKNIVPGGTISTGNVTNLVSQTWDDPSSPLYGSPNIDCNASACPIMTVARNLSTPYVANWTVSLQHAITPNLTLELAYVGNHGSNLVGIRDINQPPVGSGWDTGPNGALTLCLASAPLYNNCTVDLNG